MSKGLYIHIPFCKYICSYCDFGKKYIEGQPVDQYIDRLITELDMYMPFADINTIYIGGGTPSSLNTQQLTKLLVAINNRVDIDKIVEFSFEMNPDDVTVELLQLLKQYGVNRLSIGAQTTNEKILKLLNRKHSNSDINRAAKLATDMFDNVSFDLMFNLPMQTKEDIDDSLQFISKYDIKHISYYGLIFEDHTILSTEEHQYWDVDYESEMYSYIQNKLADLGYAQYEISNYAKPGYQSVHNIHYWQRDDYYGIGLSSSGFLNDMRYTNTHSIKDYISNIDNRIKPIIEREEIDSDDGEFERIMLSLRYNQPVTVSTKLIDYIKRNDYLVDKIEVIDNTIRLLPEYYYLSNQVILDIIEGGLDD